MGRRDELGDARRLVPGHSETAAKREEPPKNSRAAQEAQHPGTPHGRRFRGSIIYLGTFK